MAGGGGDSGAAPRTEENKKTSSATRASEIAVKLSAVLAVAKQGTLSISWGRVYYLIQVRVRRTVTTRCARGGGGSREVLPRCTRLFPLAPRVAAFSLYYYAPDR